MKLTQHLLNRIAGLLNEGATNYTVFLRVYLLPTPADGTNLETCIRESINANAELGGEEEINLTSLMAEMKELLKYAGDAEAGPDNAMLNSKELSILLTELEEGTSELAAQAKKIKRFWLKSGHPAYPVFWDYGYAFLAEEKVAILIGCSSD